MRQGATHRLVRLGTLSASRTSSFPEGTQEQDKDYEDSTDAADRIDCFDGVCRRAGHVGHRDQHASLFSPARGEPTLDEVRRATERFRDVNVALAEGYIRDPFDLCDTAEMMGRPASLGAMGVHYFRPYFLGITAPPSPRVDGVGTHMDFLKPSILIYEPQADGSLALVAVENLAFAAAWRSAGTPVPPTFHGAPFDSWSTTPTPRPTRPTCSRPTTIGTCGSIGRTRAVSSPPSIRP